LNLKVVILYPQQNIGRLLVDYECASWADHDEDCHGSYDTADMRIEFPEGFKWNCCGEYGDVEGCKVGPHEAEAEKSRKVSRIR